MGYGCAAEVTDPVVREMVMQRAMHLFRGLLHVLGARLMNVPENDIRAGWKAHQLQVAAEVDLSIPRTLMTDDPDAVRAFANEVGEVVYKPLRGPAWRLLPTRRLTDDSMQCLDAVRLAPVIFQERIPCVEELRVTIVGDQVFAGGALHEPLGDCEDSRLHPTQTLQPRTLPRPIAMRLQALMDSLELVYGAIDMRVTPDGRYVFLEINPAGQYLWVEIETGLPIS